jgi:hypothetical protein
MAHENKAADILKGLASIDPAILDSSQDEKERVLALSRELTSTLESPVDRAVGYIFKVR